MDFGSFGHLNESTSVCNISQKSNVLEENTEYMLYILK